MLHRYVTRILPTRGAVRAIPFTQDVQLDIDMSIEFPHETSGGAPLRKAWNGGVYFTLVADQDIYIQVSDSADDEIETDESGADESGLAGSGVNDADAGLWKSAWGPYDFLLEDTFKHIHILSTAGTGLVRIWVSSTEVP